MATKQLSALDAIEDAQKKTLEEQYGGRMSNQFVEELKSSTMFQFSWSELLSAAPTALSLMGSLWIAASNPKAYRIDLKDSVPQGGFKFITKRSDPKLRDCLVDVCATGGNEAFNKASMNMDALFNISRRIYSERVRSFSVLAHAVCIANDDWRSPTSSLCWEIVQRAAEPSRTSTMLWRTLQRTRLHARSWPRRSAKPSPSGETWSASCMLRQNIRKGRLYRKKRRRKLKSRWH